MLSWSLKINKLLLLHLVGLLYYFPTSDLLGEELFKTTFASFSSLLHCHMTLFHAFGLVSASYLWKGIFLNTAKSVQIKPSSSSHLNLVTSMVCRTPIHKLARCTGNSTVLCDRFYTNPVLLVTQSTEGIPLPTNFRSWCQKRVSLLSVRLTTSCTQYNLSMVFRITFFSWFQTFAVFWMLYSFFWVIPRRVNFICRRFGTLCSIFIGSYLPA